MIRKTQKLLGKYYAMLTSINIHTKDLDNKTIELINETRTSNLLNKKIYDEIIAFRKNSLDLLEPNIKLRDRVENEKINSLSVVIPCYNVENYIDELIFSLSIQSLGVESLELIFVNDGSTDTTLEKIELWKKQYPHIQILSKENEGQSIAREYGLKHVTGKYVIFLDADDFIDYNYFIEINHAINESPISSMYITRQIFYYEETKTTAEGRINKRFNFKERVKTLNLLEQPDVYQLSGATIVFNVDLLRIHNIKFPNIKPRFEDVYLLNKYFLDTNNFNVTLVKDAFYYNRKRKNFSSTLNLSTSNTKTYTSLIKDGPVSLMHEYCDKLGFVPKFLQNALLFDYFVVQGEYDNKKIELSPNDLKTRNNNLKEFFSFIDFNTLRKSNLFWESQLICYNNIYYNNKNDLRDFSMVFDYHKNYLKILLISSINNWQIRLNNKTYTLNDFETKEIPTLINGVYGNTFTYIKIPYNMFDTEEDIKLMNNNKNVPLILKKNLKDVYQTKSKDNPIMLFFDRLDCANDNAETFYTWMSKRYNLKNMYFILNKDSNDWVRLEKANFNLIDINDSSFENLYVNADYIFSSAFDRVIENHKKLRYNSKRSKAMFVFLQHGVINDDLGIFFKENRINYFIASSEKEKNLILKNSNLFENEVIVTGIPRFDKLISSTKKKIIFAPTWRREIRINNYANFMDSDYFNTYKNLLTNKTLIKSITNNNYKIEFILHPNMEPVKEFFFNLQLEENISIHLGQDIDYSKHLCEGDLLITDYSSLAFDFAKMKKPVLFYQFDHKTFFESHTYKQGIPYKDLKVGPVIGKESVLLNTISKFLAQGTITENIDYDKAGYLKYYDENNCQRIYDVIFKEEN